MIKFTINIDPRHTKKPRSIDVVIHRSLSAMREHNKKDYHDPENRTVGLCVPAPMGLEHSFKHNMWRVTYSQHVATVHFYSQGLTTEAICHEMTHAALCAYRADQNQDVRLGCETGDDEETVAYIVGDLCAKLMKELSSRGLNHKLGFTIGDNERKTRARKPVKGSTSDEQQAGVQTQPLEN